MEKVSDSDQQKWSNYLFWLEDRGIATTPRLPVAEEKRPHPQDRPQHSGESTLPSSCRLLICTDHFTDPEDVGMVHRIAGALGLRSDEYVILEGAAFEQFDFSRHGLPILVLGPGGAGILEKKDFTDLALNEVRPHRFHGQVILISHPAAMQAQPLLKMKAWEALQKLKQALA